jgi:hypothetical protein
MSCSTNHSVNIDANIDPEIYALHLINEEQNWCTVRLKCGCYCPNPCGDTSKFCKDHFYIDDFRMARTHTNFTTSKPLIIKPLPRTNINELFDLLPIEMLVNIICFIHFADLKQLYIMRIPAILALVQSDIMFNYDALFASPTQFYRVYKFESDYVRGLRAIDSAIQQLRTSASYHAISSLISELNIERARSNDRRNYNIDVDAYHLWCDEIHMRCDDEILCDCMTVIERKYMNDLKFKPACMTHPCIAHSIGRRRLFPGKGSKSFQIINEFVFDDFFAKNPAETAHVIKVYNTNPAKYGLISGPNITTCS